MQKRFMVLESIQKMKSTSLLTGCYTNIKGRDNSASRSPTSRAGFSGHTSHAAKVQQKFEPPKYFKKKIKKNEHHPDSAPIGRLFLHCTWGPVFKETHYFLLVVTLPFL